MRWLIKIEDLALILRASVAGVEVEYVLNGLE